MREYKTCTKCKQTLDLEKFNKSKAGRLGVKATCKMCDKKWRQDNSAVLQAKAKLYREANKQKRAEQFAKWAAANRDHLVEYRRRNKDKKEQQRKEWVAANRERVASKNKEWRQNNLERILEREKAYRANNLEQKRNREARRRARLRNNGVYQISKKELVALLNSPCAYCGGQSEHFDHVIPISKGGRHSIGNLVGACQSCNLSKRNLFIMEWRIKNKIKL